MIAKSREEVRDRRAEVARLALAGCLALTLSAIAIQSAAAPAAAPPDPGPEIGVERLGEKVIIVTDGGMGSQLAVNAKNGIVVFDTGWCSRIARALRGKIEQEFGRRDFAAVVLTNQRLDIVGGGGAYEGVPVIAHARTAGVLARQQADLRPHLQPLVEMWRWKEGAARRRLAGYAPGSPEARRDENWANTCQRMADDLSGDYALTVPTRTFDDRLSLDLGDMTLVLHYFGVGARGEAGLVARIPELGLLLFGRLLFHEQHMLPYLNARPWQDLNVPHTLALLDEILADEARVATVVVTSGPWPLDEIKARRRYLGELWDGAREAAACGATLAQAEEELSVEARFVYLKEWPVWQRQGAEWCAEEHQANVERFWGQFQNYAAREIFRAFRGGGVEAGLAKYDELADKKAAGLIVDDASFDSLAEALFYDGYVEAADAVARRNVQRFPDAWPVQLRLGERLRAGGDAAGALAAYRKVLALDPENIKAKQRVEELEKR